jgi:hypothetical protein
MLRKQRTNYITTSQLSHRMSASKLRALTDTVFVTDGRRRNPEPLAVLIPYKKYLELQRASKEASHIAEMFATKGI